MLNLKTLCGALWLLAAVLFACERCDGQVFLVKSEVQSCTAVDCQVEVGVSSSVCVGHVDDRWYFVTAGHTFYSDRPGVLKSQVKSAHVAIDRQWVAATVEGFDKPGAQSDLGLLSVRSPARLNALPIAPRAPEAGAEVTIGGFPSGSPYAEVRGTVVPSSARESRTDFGISTAVVRGVSGGPVLFGGSVAGIVSTSDFSSGTWAIGPAKIRARLLKHLGRLPDCGRAANPPEQRAQAENHPAPLSDSKSSPDAPARVEPSSDPPIPDDPSSAAGAAGRFAWFQLWGAIAPALGFGGPIGMGIGAAGWLIARRLGRRAAKQIQTRRQSATGSQSSTSAPGAPDSAIEDAPVAISIPASRPIASTQNRFVEVPVMNNEAEALKEAMRLEAEFTRTENPQVAMHLRRIQEMAALILQGKKIDKPGWKTD
ncbi:MAG: trypsin-like peptidase domain-containing protein [Planctomycetaceae bacterium]